ncbi:MAG: response regulator [Alphaproteobacteria bacterium]|nr:response regulator [Alphaproteobacteria bacterium]
MRILLIEDEFLVAAAVEATLAHLGYEVVGPASTVRAALNALAEEAPPDGAILDLNLRGESSLEVAEELNRQGIPFVFATGYEKDQAVGRRFPAAHWLRKPFTDVQIGDALADIGLTPERGAMA